MSDVSPESVGEVDIGAGIDQRVERLDVTLAAVAEHDRLDHRGPAEIVDMIERRFRRDQRALDFIVTEMRGSDERGAVIGAGDVRRLAAACKRGLEHRYVIGDRGDGDDVVLLCLQRVRVGAETHQGARGIRLAHEGGDMQRRARVAVARIDRRARLHQLFDFSNVAFGGRRMQASIGL